LKIKIVVWLLVASLISFVILRSGRYEYKTDNGITSDGPSGTSAFIELLKESGYKLNIVNDAASLKIKGSEPVLIISSQNAGDKAVEFINDLKADATIILFQIPTITSKLTSTTVKYGYDEKTFGTIKPVSSNQNNFFGDDDESSRTYSSFKDLDGQSQTIFFDISGRYIANAHVKKDRQVVAFYEGAIITNEHIGEEANASVALATLKTLADPQKPLTVIAEFASADGKPGLIEKLGPVAMGIWNQIIFLLVIVFLTLCVRFGFPPETRVQQRGSRELIDGVATLLRRKKQHQWALQAVFERVIRELEKRHRVGREDILAQPEKYLTEKEIRRVRDIQQRMTQPMKAEEAVDLANSLRRLV
jgi:hypothetical protein